MTKSVIVVKMPCIYMYLTLLCSQAVCLIVIKDKKLKTVESAGRLLSSAIGIGEY